MQPEVDSGDIVSYSRVESPPVSSILNGIVNARSSTMPVSPATERFLQTLDTVSGHTLTRRNDLGVLMELSSAHGKMDEFERLSFLAKFVCRVYGMMNRIGKNDDRFTMLEREFGLNLADAAALTRSLITLAPASEQERFSRAYLSMTQDGLDNLLALFCDIAWYKNWRIDHGREDTD
jgi:hypothetical protein